MNQKQEMHRKEQRQTRQEIRQESLGQVAQHTPSKRNRVLQAVVGVMAVLIAMVILPMKSARAANDTIDYGWCVFWVDNGVMVLEQDPSRTYVDVDAISNFDRK